MRLLESYKLRLRRQRLILRALRKSGDMILRQDNTQSIGANDVVLVATMRNEAIRIPYFLKYYRELGVDHFLFVDNESSDNLMDVVSGQPDISVWRAKGSYKSARFGVDWTNALLRRYCADRWVIVVDPDEFFIYPFCDSRPIHALTDWLDSADTRSFSAMLLDMYPKGKLTARSYEAGQNPMEIAAWFDPGNYMISKNEKYQNLWIQGGPRARVFFEQDSKRAPALNKIPLVKWHRSYVYNSSTHMLLPRGLNRTYEEWGGEKASGMLLHAKFLNTLPAKATEEMSRKEHYMSGVEYAAYAKGMQSHPELWCKWSEKYINWRQLEVLGLMSKGSWA